MFQMKKALLGEVGLQSLQLGRGSWPRQSVQGVAFPVTPLPVQDLLGARTGAESGSRRGTTGDKGLCAAHFWLAEEFGLSHSVVSGFF